MHSKQKGRYFPPPREPRRTRQRPLRSDLLPPLCGGPNSMDFKTSTKVSTDIQKRFPSCRLYRLTCFNCPCLFIVSLQPARWLSHKRKRVRPQTVDHSLYVPGCPFGWTQWENAAPHHAPTLPAGPPDAAGAPWFGGKPG